MFHSVSQQLTDGDHIPDIDELYALSAGMHLPFTQAQLSLMMDEDHPGALSEKLQWLSAHFVDPLEAQKFEKQIHEALTQANLPYPGASLMNARRELHIRPDCNLLDDMDDFCWVLDGTNVLITGPSGSGKSYLASALGRGALWARPFGQSLSVRYLHVPDQGNQKKKESGQAAGLYRREEQEYLNLVILDDIVCPDRFTCELLKKILLARMDFCVSTVLISPWGPHKLRKIFLEADEEYDLIGNFLQGCAWIPLLGKEEEQVIPNHAPDEKTEGAFSLHLDDLPY